MPRRYHVRLVVSIADMIEGPPTPPARKPLPILTTCDCGKTLRAPDAFAGRTVRCPACGTQLSVPAVADLSHDNDVYELDASDLAMPADGGPDDSMQRMVDRYPDTRPRILNEPMNEADAPDDRKVRRMIQVTLAAALVILLVGGGWLSMIAYDFLTTPTAPPGAKKKTRNVGYLDMLATARGRGKSVVGASNMRQLLMGITQFELTYGRYPQSLNDLVDHMPGYAPLLVNPRTGASPGFVYVKPEGQGGANTPVLYEGAAGQIDPDGSVGYLNGHIEVNLPEPDDS